MARKKHDRIDTPVEVEEVIKDTVEEHEQKQEQPQEEPHSYTPEDDTPIVNPLTRTRTRTRTFTRRMDSIHPHEMRQAQAEFFVTRPEVDEEQKTLLTALRDTLELLKEVQENESKEQKTIFKALRKIMQELKDGQEKEQRKLLQKISKTLDSLDKKMDTLISLQ